MPTMNLRWQSVEIIVLCCLSGLALLPFFIPMEFHDAQRILTILFAALILSKTLWQVKWNRSTLSTLSALSILGIVSVSQSPAPLWSGVEFALLLSVFLLPLALFQTIDGRFLYRLAITMLIIHAGYITRNLWNDAEIMHNGYPLHAVAMIDGFSNMRFYGQFLVWTIPFCTSVLVTHQPTRWRPLFISVLALGWAMAYLTGARSFLFAMLGSVLLARWLTPALWKRYVGWLLGIALLGFAFYAILVLWLPILFSSPEPETLATYSLKRNLTDSSGRFDIWIHALQQTLKNPWFGLGPMMSAETSFFKTEAHPHSYLIQWLAEWGIPFTLLLVSFLGYQLWCWQQAIKIQAEQREPLALPATTSIGAAGIAGLFDGLLVMPVSLAYLVVIVGTAVALKKMWTPTTHRFQLPGWGTALLLLPTLVLTGFTCYQTPSVIDAPFSNMAHTRFWTDGTISITSPFAKTYAMGGASNSYKRVALRLTAKVYPHIALTQCHLYMEANPQTTDLPSTPDMSIICGQQYEYLFIDLAKKQITVHTQHVQTDQWQQATFGLADTLKLAAIPQQLPITDLFTP